MRYTRNFQQSGKNINNHQLIDAIIYNVQKGMSLSGIAKNVGLHKETIRRWLKTGEDAMLDMQQRIDDYILEAGDSADLLYIESIGCAESQKPYYDFYVRFMIAESELEQSAVEAWRSHFDKDWRSIDKYLSKRLPDDYANKSVNSIQSEDTKESSNNTKIEIYLPENNR